MFGTIGAGRKSKLERFAVVRLSGTDSAREAYRESVSNNLKILKTAAKKTIGLRPKQVANKGIFFPFIESMSREQQDLRLRVPNAKEEITRGEMTRGELRKRRSKSLHEMHRSMEDDCRFWTNGPRRPADV